MPPIDPSLDPESAFTALRRVGAPALLFDGRGGLEGAWSCRVAIEPRVAFSLRASGDDPARALRPLDALLARRRAVGGSGGTGVVVLSSYEAFAQRSASSGAGWDLIALEVDGVVAFRPGGPPEAFGPAELVRRAVVALERAGTGATCDTPEAGARGRPRTSLGRDAYLGAVARVQRHIAAGDVYQANLTQQFAARFDGDPWALYRAIVASTPAPRSAYLEVPGLALASASPEIFVDVDAGGRMETRPIKGTRARGLTTDDDELAVAALLASTKDHAELVMIVDVLRNDLGRVASTGSVHVPELASLRSYAAVHHLVARVVAQRRSGVTPGELLAAVFPGGSITGAPKQRAIELLREIEPCPRGLYTGSLFWFDDDGSMASSILIRSAIVTGGFAQVGAGGGVVADSDPEAEWSEANAKARALTRALGFEPEEAA